MKPHNSVCSTRSTQTGYIPCELRRLSESATLPTPGTRLIAAFRFLFCGRIGENPVMGIKFKGD